MQVKEVQYGNEFTLYSIPECSLACTNNFSGGSKMTEIKLLMRIILTLEHGCFDDIANDLDCLPNPKAASIKRAFYNTLRVDGDNNKAHVAAVRDAAIMRQELMYNT